MKTFGRYFGYITKKSILRTVIFALIGLIVVWVSAINGLNKTQVHARVTNIGAISTVLGFLCGIIPVIELSGFKNRRNLDTIYSFPIKRWKMAIAHYISGVAQITAIHSICFFASYIYYLLKTDYFALEYMIPYFFASLGLGIIMYSVFMFINSQANTVVDGVLFSILWLFGILVLLMAVCNILFICDFIKYREADHIGTFASHWSFPFSSLNNVTLLFEELIHVNRGKNHNISRFSPHMYMVAVWGIIGIGSAVGYFLSFIKKPAYKASEVSNSVLGYKVLIPIYFIWGATLFALESDPMILVFDIIMMIVGYVIYRRGFRFKLPDILSMVGSLIVAILFAVLAK